MGTTNTHRVQLRIEGEIAIIRLGSDEERVVVLSMQRMDSFVNAMAEVRKNTAVKALIIMGTNPDVFCAGADIGVINSIIDPVFGQDLAKRGQEVFQLLEELPVRKIAAISGACMGGGCELVLACDYRIGSHRTKIGLPEIKLGILPGFGGTQRLPRLVGLPQAFDMILQGKVLDGKRAAKIGLLDEVLPDGTSFQGLETRAREVARAATLRRHRRIPLAEKLLTYTAIGRSIVKKKAESSVYRQTKGHYPAPYKAIDAVLTGLSEGTAAGYVVEARALGDLIVSQESKSLVHLYFLTEDASKIGKAAKIRPQDTPIAVLGAGVMGSGIAAAFLMQKFPVVVFDPYVQAHEKSRKHIEGTLEKKRSLTAEARQELLGQLKITAEMPAIAGCKVVIEAVLEDLKIKEDVFGKVCKLVDPQALIASNTSSLKIDALAGFVTNPQRFLGLHFFNPVEKMPLVEIIRGKATDEKSLVLAAAVVSGMGKYPVIVEDVPGFLVNRILGPYLVESSHLLSEGVSVEEIDKAAVNFGMPMGPLRLLDEIGLDVAAHVVKNFEKAYGERMQGPDLLSKFVAEKRMGKKSGRGFYLYEGKDSRPDPEVRKFLGIEKSTEIEEAVIADRLILSMVNEAARCLDDGVAGKASADAAGQIDLASVMGTGFAPFRGGLLFYANHRGTANLNKRLAEFAKSFGKRFTPAPGIADRAKNKQGFFS